MDATAEEGRTLLELQELDLKTARNKKKLNDLPELKELARRRSAYKKLKSESVKLYAHRKDLETELADLDAEDAILEEKVAAAQARLTDDAGYRLVQDVEQELTNAAKQMEKVSYKRTEMQHELDSVRASEAKVQDGLERLEGSISEATDAARQAALALQRQIREDEARRDGLAGTLSPAVLATYENALERFDGLAVEELEGSVPSVCRTTLAPAQLSDLHHQGPVSTCPYCHRIIVTSTGEEEQ